MKYKIDIGDLEPINILILDASVEFNDLNNLKPSNSIAFVVDRRTFEDVKRGKFLFWNITYYKGEKSLVRLKGVKKIELIGVNDEFKGNHFINEFLFDKEKNSLDLQTAFGLTASFSIGEDFEGELIDLEKSGFGSGRSFGKHGFTKQEWEDYLKTKKYAT